VELAVFPFTLSIIYFSIWLALISDNGLSFILLHSVRWIETSRAYNILFSLKLSNLNGNFECCVPTGQCEVASANSYEQIFPSSSSIS
jgi:hypothetical protein